MEKIQILVHANGDAAIDMLLKAHEFASAGINPADTRTTIIHSQFVRKVQLQKYAEYKMIGSIYTDHTFFFGDTHIENRGMEQASYMSLSNSALKLGIPATNHTDLNVSPIDQMRMVWTTVNRTTRTGILLGADERVKPYQALKAITINVAHQYFKKILKVLSRKENLPTL